MTTAKFGRTALRVVWCGAMTLGVLALPASAVAAEPTPTFTKDIAPIFQGKCQVCHRPDSIGPMALQTYEDVRPWARSIKEKVVNRDMPPWYIDRNVGIRRFKNDRSLSDEEIATIVNWVDAGAPKGNPADMPPPRQFEDMDKWHIGQPDLIVTLPQDQLVRAEGPDEWKDIVVDPWLTEDRYIKALETKPSKGFKVVHHTVTRMLDPEGFDSDDFQGSFLNEYALGKNGDAFPDGAGRLIKAGAKINFNLHLHPIGEETRANVELGLKLYPSGYVPKYIEISQGVGQNTDLDIPPNSDNVRADGYMTLTRPARLLSFQPHLHNRGKASCVEAVYPAAGDTTRGVANRVETLSCVSKYRFAWHIVYLYGDDVQPLLPAGTILHVTSWYNNTSTNRFNPDPDNWVGYGQRSIEEMSFAWMSWYYLSDEEFKQQVEERKAKKTSN